MARRLRGRRRGRADAETAAVEVAEAVRALEAERRRWVYQQLFAEIRLRAGHDPEVTRRR